MAAAKFYKFGAPRTKRYTSNGALIAVTVIDQAWGVFATDNEIVQGELDAMIAGQRGGVFAIGAPEYHRLKKNQISTSPWREEIGGRGLEVNKQPVQSTPRPNPAPTEAEGVVAGDAMAAQGAEAESQPDALERPKAVKRKKPA